MSVSYRMSRKLPLVLVTALVFGASSSASASVLPGFHSPTKNIRCLLIPGGRLLCSIGQADYAKTLQTGCTGIDWHGWLLGPTSKGQVNCSGGILYTGSQHPSYVNLPYGQSWRRGAFTCTSRVIGVTCTNPKGHGLFISRASWRAW